ncbi:hypothetical protein X801_06255, partial [Opisthorchis viverrini]
MMVCLATLKQLQYPDGPSSCRTIGAIVARLPGTTHPEWFNLAAKSVKSRGIPEFDELTNFKCDKADTAALLQS